MTLHDTAEISKKGGIALGFSIGGIILLVILFKIGGFIQTILFPPQIAPPNQAYGQLPQIVFPQSTVKGQFTYTINTVDGSLPQNFPDRILLYPVIISQPNLLNLDDAKNKVSSLGFIDQTGNPLTEITRGGPNYEWDELIGFQRKIIYNIVNQNFTMTSNYLTSLMVLNAQFLGDQPGAINTVNNFLSSINQLPADVNITLTQNPSPDAPYETTPQLYSITNGQLTPTTSLSNAQIIRVDLYQKEIDYSFTAGQNQDLRHFQNFDMKMPIMYPYPPFSTMNFLVASGQNDSNVVSAIFNHQMINTQPDKEATYPIKTVQQAFDELKNGKAYIAAYNGSGSGNQVFITKVYLAYYLGVTQQSYLMPVIVFEGQNGFFAYVSAITSDALQ
ncbi:MAG TPA: hypothetical protein VNW29_00930 [Candidatus Sulfotelmatobacter sp.]|jgi:hypothetical protein|nr:hypothetical protein [Candidatus Sulfotelmatobacter sp.]